MVKHFLSSEHKDGANHGQFSQLNERNQSMHEHKGDESNNDRITKRDDAGLNKGDFFGKALIVWDDSRND